MIPSLLVLPEYIEDEWIIQTAADDAARADALTFTLPPHLAAVEQVFYGVS